MRYQGDFLIVTVSLAAKTQLSNFTETASINVDIFHFLLVSQLPRFNCVRWHLLELTTACLVGPFKLGLCWRDVATLTFESDQMILLDRTNLNGQLIHYSDIFLRLNLIGKIVCLC